MEQPAWSKKIDQEILKTYGRQPYPFVCFCRQCTRSCKAMVVDGIMEYDHLSLDDSGLCDKCRKNK